VEMDGTEAIQICEKFLIEEQGMEKVELSSIKMVLEGIPQYVAEFFTQHTNRRKVVKHRRYMLQVGVLGKQVKASFISYRLPGSIPKGEMKEMENGMLFNDISVGDGEMVRPGATVRIDYVLSLLDGKLITNTHTQNTSRVFRLESAPFKGMADGLIGMRANGKRKLVIPPSLGYGAEGAKHIPADSTLVIDLVLKSVQ
jgi:FKBP-type peptidyl-prolyl cis-trans isomerase